MENLYSDLKNCNSDREAAKLLSEITWTCGDCSPDSQAQCQKCLVNILKHPLETIAIIKR